MNSKRISIYLHEGLPQGVRVVGIDQWSGRVVAGPRNAIKDIFYLLDQYNYDGSSLYFLIGEQDQSDLPQIYIGETDKFRERIKQHEKNKDWWNDVVIFFNPDGSLTTTGSKYLESICIDRIGAMGHCTLDNGNSPAKKKILLEESSGLESFYQNILTILPLLGYNIAVSEDAGTNDQLEDTLFYCTRKGVDARGELRKDGKMKVFKGSTGVENVTPSFSDHAYSKLRDELIKIGKLTEKDGQYMLKDNYVFSSPSAAAAVLLGNSANGKLEWKNKDGVSIKTLIGSNI